MGISLGRQTRPMFPLHEACTSARIAFRIDAEIVSQTSTTVSKSASTYDRSSRSEPRECITRAARHRSQMTEEVAASPIGKESTVGSSPTTNRWSRRISIPSNFQGSVRRVYESAPLKD
jgi:hypothetical protein